MVKHNHLKTTLFALVIGFLVAVAYLVVYVNGYLGKPLFDWSFLQYFISEFLHPINLIGIGLTLFISYKLYQDNFKTEIIYRNKYKVTFGLVSLVLSLLMVLIYLYEKDLAFVVGFFYFYLIGFIVSYYFGVSIFRIDEN